MGRLTTEGQRILLDIVGNREEHENKDTTFHQPPVEVSRNTAIDYVDRIFSATNINNLKIIKVFGYKDLKCIIFQHETQNNMVFGVFDLRDNLIYSFSKIEQLTSDVDINEFKDVWITRSGIICALQKDGSNVNFIRFTPFLDDLQDYINEPNLKIFLSASFNISTEITKDDDGSDLDIKLGNSMFKNYEQVGFNQDAYNDNKYSFALWNVATKEIRSIIFEINTQTINSIKDVDFIVNDVVNLSQGQNLPSANFDGLSQLGILTGEQNIIRGETSLGSIIFSTEKEAGQNLKIPFKYNFPATNSIRFTKNNIFLNILREDPARTSKSVEYKITDKSSFFANHLKIIEDYKNSNPTNLDYNFSVNFSSNFTWKIYKDEIDKMINEPDFDMYLSINLDHESFRYSRDFSTTSTALIELSLKNSSGKELSSQNVQRKILTSNQRNQDRLSYLSDYFLDGRIYSTSYTGKFESELRLNISTSITPVLEISGIRTQSTINETNSSQILISKKDNADVINYKIIQSENNTYNGSNPVFLSPLRAFIPLKSKDTNQYSIYQFNGKTSQASQTANRFFNYTSPNNHIGIDDLEIDLLEPENITRVLLNQIELSSSEYELNDDKIKITKDISKDDNIIIEYTTKIGAPIKLSINDNIVADDIYIEKIDNTGELATTLPSIIGVGDTINNNKAFSFNLYNDEKEYDELAEIEVDVTDFQVKYITGYRQKNILWIVAYSENYSKSITFMTIYPEAKVPYTYIPYRDTDNELRMSRLNVNNGDFKSTIFDNKFIDTSTSGNLTLASTRASETDLNAPNSKTLIYGETGKWILEDDRSISKTRNEIKQINANVNVKFMTEDINGDAKEIKQISNEAAVLFNPNVRADRKIIHLDTFELIDDNGSVLIGGKITDYIQYNLIDSSTMQLDIHMQITKNYDSSSQKAKKIIIKNENGDTIIDDELIDCDTVLDYQRVIIVENI